MISEAYANNTIIPGSGEKKKQQLHYNTNDIVQLMLWAEDKAKKFTEEFSKVVSPDYRGMRDLHDFILENIEYKRDPRSSQWVKSPGLLWRDRQGDCKSYTLFIVSVLQNLGIPYIMRFVSYKKKEKRPTHVYPIAIIDGQEIIIDVVYSQIGGGRFNKEKPYMHKQDYGPGLAYIEGMEDQQAFFDTLLEIDQQIDDVYLQDDLTKMNQGELFRYQEAQRLNIIADQTNDPSKRSRLKLASGALRAGSIAMISGIGNTEEGEKVLNFLRQTSKMNRPAFKAPTLKLNLKDPNTIGFLGKFIKKVSKGVANIVKGVGDFFKKAWSKLMNWIFKSGLVNAGPYHLFQFAEGPLNAEAARRKKKQKDSLEWMVKLGVGRDNIKKALKNGIHKSYGHEPDKIIAFARGRGEKVEGIGFLPLAAAATGGAAKTGILAKILDIGIKAFAWVMDVVKKIMNLFKKKNAPELTELDVSDPHLLVPQQQSSGSIAPLALGAGALYLLSAA